MGFAAIVKYLPRILRSPRFDAAGALEASYYLVLPFLQVLGFGAWTFILVGQIDGAALDPNGFHVWIDNFWGLLALTLVFGVGPFAIWGFIYKIRCEPATSWLHAAGIGIGMWLYQVYVIASISKALTRIIRGNNGWAKTRRNADAPMVGSTAIEA